MGFSLGNLVGGIGKTFGLPELGISESLGGDRGGGTSFQEKVEPINTATKNAILSGGQPQSTASTPDKNASDSNYNTGGQVLDYTTSTPSYSAPAKSAAQIASERAAAEAAAEEAQQKEDDLAYLSDQEGILSKLLKDADTTQKQGLTKIDDSYNKEYNSTIGRQNQTLSDFATNEEDTQRDRQSAYNEIDRNTRTMYSSLQRLLGLAGSSNSSAAKFAAPKAVAREASGERTDQGETYSKNLRNIDVSRKRAKSEFETILEELMGTRNNAESDLKSGVLREKQSINEQLAEVGREKALVNKGRYSDVKANQSKYRSAINDATKDIQSLFEQYRTPVFKTATPNIDKPVLSDYDVDRKDIKRQAGGGDLTTGGEYSPYAQFLLKNQKKDEALV